MKCSALSCFGGFVGAFDVGALETGGSAMESSPPHADSSRTGAARAPMRIWRMSMATGPPETAVELLLTVLTSHAAATPPLPPVDHAGSARRSSTASG